MIDAIGNLYSRATRRARRVYHYVTGDRSCLGFVRVACLVVVLCDAVSVVAYLRDGNLKDGGFALGSSMVVLLLLGPHYFQRAASTDRSPIGPGVDAVRHDLAVAADVGISVVLTGSILYDTALVLTGAAPPAGDLLAVLGYPAMIFMLWAPSDRGGGEGKRTLTGDVRRLIGRVAPGTVGNTARHPLPAPVDI